VGERGKGRKWSFLVTEAGRRDPDFPRHSPWFWRRGQPPERRKKGGRRTRKGEGKKHPEATTLSRRRQSRLSPPPRGVTSGPGGEASTKRKEGGEGFRGIPALGMVTFCSVPTMCLLTCFPPPLESNLQRRGGEGGKGSPEGEEKGGNRAVRDTSPPAPLVKSV